MAGFVQWGRQGPGLRKVNGKAPNGVQAAVPPHVAFEIVLRVQVGLGPLPDSCLIEQFPDYCEVRAKKFCGIILGLSKDADNYVQTHSGTVPVRPTVVAEARFRMPGRSTQQPRRTEQTIGPPLPNPAAMPIVIGREDVRSGSALLPGFCGGASDGDRVSPARAYPQMIR
jgi:hypothetical protein